MSYREYYELDNDEKNKKKEYVNTSRTLFKTS